MEHTTPPMAMTLDSLIDALDREFSLTDWAADPAMSHLVPKTYHTIGYDFAAHFAPDFCTRFNGLMLRAGEVITEVYCAVFPTPEVLATVLQQAGDKALLFLHHPLDMETTGRGFLPISPVHLQALSDRGISIYTCHAPLDCHSKIGTAISLVSAFALQQESEFAQYGHGYVGRVGVVAPVTVTALVQMGKQAFHVNHVERGGGNPNLITRIAVLPGAGDHPFFLQEASQLGAQAIITGEWSTRLTPSDPDAADWVAKNRAACTAFAHTSTMALLGFSHAATEYLVMERQLATYFRSLGLMVYCVKQSDWWR